MSREGRYARGQAHGRAKVDDDDVLLAIDLVERYGLTSREVAEKFEVSPSTVRMWRTSARRAKPQAW